MDFPVEATVHLDAFVSRMQAFDILRSHDFAVTVLERGQVRVKGSFLKLKAAKALLDKLLKSQPKADVTSSSSSMVPKVSSGAVPKHHSSTDGSRSRPRSRNKPLQAFPLSPTVSSSLGSRSPTKGPTTTEYSASFSPTPEQRRSFRAESFIVDSDVFAYAKRFRKESMDGILESHNVQMETSAVGDSCNVTVVGKSARLAAGKLQSLLAVLSQSLRTQDVSLSDMNHEGRALLQSIRENRDIHNFVLLCPKNGKVHLIGPSRESYELKQRLLGTLGNASGRTGRTLERNRTSRSYSLSPGIRMSTERQSRPLPSSAGAAGYSPSKYQDVKEESTKPKRGAGGIMGFLSRGSNSQSRRKSPSAMTNGNMHGVGNNPAPNAKEPKKSLSHLLKVTSDDIWKKMKNMKK